MHSAIYLLVSRNLAVNMSQHILLKPPNVMLIMHAGRDVCDWYLRTAVLIIHTTDGSVIDERMRYQQGFQLCWSNLVAVEQA